MIARYLPRPRGLREQCIALAGMYQSLAQVQACARDGEPSDVPALRTVLSSVLRIDAPDAAAVYGGLAALAPGLELLGQHLARRMSALRLEQARYAANVLYLERRLAASPDSTRRLGDALRALAQHGEARAVDDPWMLERMAALYVDHVSALGPRIMISGEPVHLKTAHNAERIRALLLAALRAAVLWRQSGGGQLKLALLRTVYAGETEALARSAAP